MSRGEVVVTRVTTEDCERRRDEALEVVGWTLEAWREARRETCCYGCMTPWEDLSASTRWYWDEIDGMEFLLGEPWKADA